MTIVWVWEKAALSVSGNLAQTRESVMSPEIIHIFWFSPVYHTRQLALTLGSGIAGALQGVIVRHHDFTQPAWRCPDVGANDLAILAVPVYAGRVPPLAAGRLARLAGNGAPCVLLVTYGNRAYDSALAELKQLAMSAGFRPFAAAACVARHTIGLVFAEGRPTAEDLAQLEEFGSRAAARLAGPLTLVDVPGGVPDKPAPVFPLPQSINDNCVFCGHCWERCPAAAIRPGQPADVDSTKCICCMRCVAICPEDARVPDPAFIDGIRNRLTPLCATAKANEFFGV